MRVSSSCQIIAVKDEIVFPNTVMSIHLQEPPSWLENAMDGTFILVLIKTKIEGAIKLNQIHSTGTKVEIVQNIHHPDGSLKILVEGQSRVQIKKVFQKDQIDFAAHEQIEELNVLTSQTKKLAKEVENLFQSYVESQEEESPSHTILSILDVSLPSQFTNLISSYLSISAQEKQALLAENNIQNRLKLIHSTLERQISLVGLEKDLVNRTHERLDRERQEYFLKTKLSEIQQELNITSSVDEVLEYHEKLAKLSLSKETETVLKREIQKLDRAPDESSEASNVRSYLDFVLDLPWKKKSRSKMEIDHVQEVLNQNHFSLENVKERILEHLAVYIQAGRTVSNVLCLAGPPGVGKSSIVKSVAQALGRKFVRISLGGVRDEAELTGHRRTYVGALPGKFISAVANVKSKSPVILLDEIDKLVSDFRGDPSSVLLELLDPDQNDHFVDQYLQVPFDLSHVLFICTCNDLSLLPLPLLNRLEVIEIPGYNLKEKITVASVYLIPKHIKQHGLSKLKVNFSKPIVEFMIHHYTSDSGLRELERVIKKLMRKMSLQKLKK
ncbi:MAG: LON peptidase substrate-binding domain-containing protein, partial [Candidatus Margulisbacteria bacterium]|nr:LON peptidase substrate-binding domain-containing protein [Candidatus Margulisiibacteriota bacterium]